MVGQRLLNSDSAQILFIELLQYDTGCAGLAIAKFPGVHDGKFKQDKPTTLHPKTPVELIHNQPPQWQHKIAE